MAGLDFIGLCGRCGRTADQAKRHQVAHALQELASWLGCTRNTNSAVFAAEGVPCLMTGAGDVWEVAGRSKTTSPSEKRCFRANAWYRLAAFELKGLSAGYRSQREHLHHAQPDDVRASFLRLRWWERQVAGRGFMLI